MRLFRAIMMTILFLAGLVAIGFGSLIWWSFLASVNLQASSAALVTTLMTPALILGTVFGGFGALLCAVTIGFAGIATRFEPRGRRMRDIATANAAASAPENRWTPPREGGHYVHAETEE